MVEFYTLFFSTAILMFLAEIGDKTNILLISLISKHNNTKVVISGGIVGIIIVTIIGALIGAFASNLLPLWLVPLISGSIFLWLGLIEFIGKNDNEDIELEEEKQPLSKIKIFSRSLSLMFLAEFGDKSQIFVITSATLNDPIAVAFGAIFGMLIIFLIVGIIGVSVLSKVPEEKMNQIAAVLFIIAGIWILTDGIITLVNQ